MMKRNFTFLIAAVVMLLALITQPMKAVGQTKDPILLFHETFGDNSNSATAWDAATYSVQSGEEEVYEDAEYAVTNAKVSKNTMGQTASALVSSQGKTGSVIIGPLDVSSYSDIEISYYFGMSAGTWNTTYSFVKLSYLGNNDTYVELTRTDSNGNPTGSVSNHNNYKQAVYSLPQAAISDALNLKFEFYCYQVNKNGQEIGQAYFDEINMTGIESTPTPTTYTVSFDCDGGEGCHDDITGIEPGDDNFTVPDDVPTRDCYTFDNFYTGSDNEIYVPGETYTITDDLTLTASWTLNKFTISYSPGEGTGDAYSDENLNCGSDYTFWSVTDLEYTAPAGKPTFVNWKDQDNATYAAGDEIQVSKELTLTAQWTSATLYAVTFNCNGDNVEGCPANMNVEAGTQITLPDAPTREGYTFNCGGWWNMNDNSRYAPGSPYVVNAAVTFRADWIENQSAPAFTVTGVSNGTTDTYYATASVSINTVSGYTYYYTTNGDEPTTSSTEYTSAIVVNTTGSTTIKAIATQYGCTVSPVGTKTITIVQPNEATFTDGVYTTLNSENAYNTWYAYSVTGDQVWTWSSTYAKMTGYVNPTSNANEDWLISPKMQIVNDKLAVSFDCVGRYDDDDNVNDMISAWYSTDYPGYGDPTAYSWTEVSTDPALPFKETSWAFISVACNLTGTDVYFALRYKSTISEAGTFEVKNFTAKQCYPITYYANGGDGTTADANSPYAVGTEVTILDNAFTAPDGKEFIKWNTQSDGIGTDKYPGNNITMTTTGYELYAIWGDACVLTATMNATTGEAVYDYNSGEKRFNITPSSSVKTLGGCDIYDYGFVYSTTVEDPEIDADNCTKVQVGETQSEVDVEFNTTLNGLTLGETYHVRSYATNAAGTAYSEVIDVAVPANFDEYRYEISYTTNGTAEASTYVYQGAPISGLATPTEANVPEGFTFMGWYDDDYALNNTAPTYVKNGDEINNNLLLKAVFAIAETKNVVQNKSLTLKSGNVTWASGSGYRGGTATVDNISFTIANGMVSGDYIQLRKNDGVVYNTTALGDYITSITATVGVNSIIVYEGEEQNPSSSAVSIKDGVYTFSGNTNYFAITSTTSYTQVYFTINYVKTSANTVYSSYCTSVSHVSDMAIVGYGNSEGGYYLIASPVATTPVVAGMITDDGSDPENRLYDLYYFDQSEENEWQNYRAQTFILEPGKGYLYANKVNLEGVNSLSFTGAPYSGDGIINLDYDENATFAGWNLIGNPFATNATIPSGRDYYVLNDSGSELIAGETHAIGAKEGIFVKASAAGESVTFTQAAKGNSVQNTNLVLNLSNSNGIIDRAIVRFDECQGLEKFQLNPNHTKVFFTQGNKDYAVVSSANEGEMPVNFKAETRGTYTLNVNAGNVEVSYLHLIDNLTGANVDLLANPSYTFEGKRTDYASRFRLVFKANADVEDNTATETFAYYNGSEWVISNPSTGSGSATLQVIDVMGRVLRSEQINGNTAINLNQAAGIYMLRLVNGENVMVQKVVVR